MKDTPDPLQEIANSLGEKAPNSIKEVVKVLNDLIVKFVEASAEIKAEVRKLASSNKAIKDELASVKKSLGFFSDSFDEIKKDTKSLRQELTVIQGQTLEFQKENQKITKELRDTQKQLIELKQYGRRNNIELKGVPSSKNEDLHKILQGAAASLQVSISSNDIDVVHRVPTRGDGPANIIVRFVSRRTRDRILHAAKKTRLNTTMLGFEENEPVFVNEHLCPENKILLGKAINTKREKNWKFTWVSEGKILMRKTENSKAVHVSCEDDLAKIT